MSALPVIDIGSFLDDEASDAAADVVERLRELLQKPFRIIGLPVKASVDEVLQAVPQWIEKGCNQQCGYDRDGWRVALPAQRGKTGLQHHDNTHFVCCFSDRVDTRKYR